jgi:hypothetical protein
MGWNVLNFFTSRQEDSLPAVLADPTLYCVETIQRTYYGRIIFQDDVQLKLQTEENKAVKILKENIKRVQVMRTSTEQETQSKWKQH